MMELMQIRFSFLCRINRENMERRLPIILRITYRKERRDGLNGRVKREFKDSIIINKNLELIHRKANQIFEELTYSGEPFSMDQIVNKLKGKDEKPELLVDYLRKRNEEIKLRAGVDISLKTYEKYKRSLWHMINFLQGNYEAKDYLLVKLEKVFSEKYSHNLRLEKKIDNNSSVKYLTSLKTMLMPVIESGIIYTPD